MKKGVFCISIDLELLWGRKDLDYSKFIAKTKKERKIIKHLLNLFKKYEIPTTWATVGKLMEKGDPLWYAPDIIKMIKKVQNQEIGSHSYTHPEFTKIDSSEAVREYKKPKSRSFVYPRNKIKYLYLLKKSGFKAYRGKDKTNFEVLMPRIPPVYKPQIKKGLVNIPGSMYFVSARGIRKLIPAKLRYLKAKLGIQAAVKENKIFHLWFHPVDFADQGEKLFKDLELTLKFADKKRREDKLEIKNMLQIANSVK